MNDARAFVRKQTLISVIITMAISAAFFFINFGGIDRITVFKPNNFVVDFLPQAAFASFMAALMPALQTRSAFAHGILPGSARSVTSIVLRAFAYAALGLGLGGLAFASLYYSRIELIPWVGALAIKIAFGALLGFIITPPAVRAVLKQG